VIGLSRHRAALVVIDIQDRLAPAMPEEILAQLVRNTRLLIEAASRLAMPIVVSQQYPKGLGPTIAPIEDALASAPRLHRFDKVEFSAAAAPAFVALAPKLGCDQWILCGMETHVCVYQTARGLVARGDQVHVVADAVASRATSNWKIGLSLAAHVGAVVTSAEASVFDLLERAGTEEFKALSKAIK
jgi:nicotinamidase-related amidase